MDTSNVPDVQNKLGDRVDEQKLTKNPQSSVSQRQSLKTCLTHRLRPRYYHDDEMLIVTEVLMAEMEAFINHCQSERSGVSNETAPTTTKTALSHPPPSHPSSSQHSLILRSLLKPCLQFRNFTNFTPYIRSLTGLVLNPVL